jgi:AcrR family transcriptional regulator
MSRTREFDLDRAVDAALHVFWQKGYEGTSLSALTEALGINRPSLYAAFGSKEGLFLRVVDRYVSGPGAPVSAAMNADTAREVATRMLRFYADAAGQADRPRGCLLVQGALACGDESEPVKQALTDQRHFAEAALVTRFERARREGDLSKDARPMDLARYVWTVCHGLAVQAAGGATRDQLRRVAELAMRVWPS